MPTSSSPPREDQIFATDETPLAAPLISCLMVTLPIARRLPHVASAVEAYLKQTHARRELVVIVNGGDSDGRAALVRYLKSLDRDDIRIVETPGEKTLGSLRNAALEASLGEVVCQWDDDDLYHPERLAEQSAHLMKSNLEAAYLQEVMQYAPGLRSLFLTNWRATPAGAHPGTLMAKRSAPIRYSVDGAQARLGEDLEVALALRDQGLLLSIDRRAHLFVYVSHGANSWDDGHHDMLRAQLSVSKGLLLRRESELREGLKPFGFEAVGVTVHGANGPAFDIP